MQKKSQREVDMMMGARCDIMDKVTASQGVWVGARIQKMQGNRFSPPSFQKEGALATP